MSGVLRFLPWFFVLVGGAMLYDRTIVHTAADLVQSIAKRSGRKPIVVTLSKRGQQQRLEVAPGVLGVRLLD